MRAVIFCGVRDVRLVDLPLPEPGAGEVRLKVSAAGVCATDRHIVSGHFAVRPPRILGHELAGVIDAIGPGVPADWLGQTCGVRPARFCGICPMCMSGAPQLCQNFQCLGNTHDGGYAEYTLVQVGQLIPLDGLDVAAAVWLEPLACVLQALLQAGMQELSGPALVLGAGVLGRLMTQVIRALTSNPLAVIDPNPTKIAEAVALGAQVGWIAPRQGPAPDATLSLQQWAPHGLALVIDTSGSPDAIRRAVDWAGPRGKVLLFGVSDPAATVCLAPHVIFSKELTLLASSGMTPASFESAVALLCSGRLDLHTQKTVTIGLNDLPAHLMGQASPQSGKLIVRPGTAGEARP